ncbi:MAG: hypothetical protein ABEJ83_03090 [Candidatus Nanohaloarchaea archaeon]
MKKTVLALSLLFFLANTAALSNITVTNQDNQKKYFETGDTLSFKANLSGTENVTLRVENSTEDVVFRQTREAEQNISFKFQNIQDPGRYSYALFNQQNGLLDGSFYIASDKPRIISVVNHPLLAYINSNVTVQIRVLDAQENVETVTLNESGNQSFTASQVRQRDNLQVFEKKFKPEKKTEYRFNVTARDSNGFKDFENHSFQVYNVRDPTQVTVEVAPSCSTTLDYFLLPGNGKIVQNKTGVFVEILSNSGNVESNITIDYLDVTFEGDNPWSRGEEIGKVIQSYPGEKFPNVRIREAVTYFELFKATYQIGNYTGRSRISTSCEAGGVRNKRKKLQELNSSYKCTRDTNKSDLFCHNKTVISQDYVAAQTTTANFTETANVTINNQRNGTTAYSSEITLNDTEYTAYLFNATSTKNYDYSCVSENSVLKPEKCGYEGSIIQDKKIKIQNIEDTGENATYAQLKINKDYVNTTLRCADTGNKTFLCNYSYDFIEQFSFYGNFEIVHSIGGANRSGNLTSNRSIPGDNASRGSTPRPEPEPEPKPEPKPEPEISINIQPVKDKYTTRQGVFKAAEIEVTNVGNTSLQGIELRAMIDKFRESWEVRNARIGNLSVGETVTREVFVRPARNTDPGTYVVPVSGYYEGRQLDLDYFTLEVKKASYVPKIEIQEAPGSLEIQKTEETDIPVLISNAGKRPVEGIEARLQNAEDCVDFSAGTIDRISVNGSKSIQMEFEAYNDTASCEATLVVSSNDGAYAFSDIEIDITPQEGLIPPKHRMPLVAILWTAALIVYGLITKKYELDYLSVKIPFIILLLGETVILLYALQTAGILPLSAVLPF